MNEPVVEHLKSILEALTVRSPTTFTFAGRPFDVQSSPFPQGLTGSPSVHGPLVDLLHQVLYVYAYTQPFDPAVGLVEPPQEPGEDLSASLSRVNASRDRWDPDWVISQVAGSGQVVAEKHGATRTLWPGEFLTQDGPGTPPRIGAVITTYSPRESITMQPGFYFAFGQSTGELHDIHDMVRFYWTLNEAGAPRLIREVSRTLNRFQTPFRLKCCCRRNLFSRLDSAVLYVNKRHYRIAAELLVDIHRGLRDALRGPTPLFTRRLGHGLAFSEDPGLSESFGTFCCRVLAEALWIAAMAGRHDLSSRLETIRSQFESYGVGLDKPHLRSYSVDLYEFPSYA